jgi:hypothetical protein
MLRHIVSFFYQFLKNDYLRLILVYFRYIFFNIFYKFKDEIIEMKTEAGDILFEDTSGLHKGQRLKKGNRLTLVFQYSSCLFGSVPKKIHFPPLKTDKLNNCIEKNKKLFSNFY